MKKMFFLLSIIITFGEGIVNAQQPKGNILPYQIYQHKLPNGLNVVTVPYDSPGLAAFYVVMRVGSRDEIEVGKTGFAHFFEHMMFRGTEKYPKEKYSDALKATGASANANTSLDRTLYHMTGNAAMLDKMFELESDRFMNLKYSEQDFKTVADWGMNVIRIPFNCRLIETKPYQYSVQGLSYLDNAVRLAKKYGLWVILDLHAAPGAQNHDWHSDSLGKAELWTKKINRIKTYALWERIADRYKDSASTARDRDCLTRAPVGRG